MSAPKMEAIKRRKLGRTGLQVSGMALGHSMGQDFSPTAEDGFIALIHGALDIGVNFFDTSDAYAAGVHELWLGRSLRGRREQAVLATKFGNLTLPNGKKATNGRPEYAKACCEASLQRLGTDCIDLYYLHRVDPAIPIEDTVGAMADLVAEGKVRYLGLCEASPATLARACRTHPIAALQTEYSLWCRGPAEEALPICRQLGVGLVAYAPLGRGLLTGNIRDTSAMAPTDRRLLHPRFHRDNLNCNLALVDQMQSISKQLGLTSAQIALAWAASRGDDIIPLVGTKRTNYLEQNAAAMKVSLSQELADALEDIFAPGNTAGARYPTQMLGDLGI